MDAVLLRPTGYWDISSFTVGTLEDVYIKMLISKLIELDQSIVQLFDIPKRQDSPGCRMNKCKTFKHCGVITVVMGSS